MFTPVHTLFGGYLLHLSTSSLLELTGRVFGVSGIVAGAIFGDRARWRWSTLAGLALGPVLVWSTGLGRVLPDSGLGSWAQQSPLRLVAGGLLVGFGSRLGSGCTSGHFLCGASRLSPRSLVATSTFMLTAILTALLIPSPLLPPPDLALHLVPPSKAIDVPDFTTIRVLLTVIAAVITAQKSLFPFLPLDRLKQLPYAVDGLVFALGLQMSGMVSPTKVVGFLSPFSPGFDPSLALIVLGGVLPNAFHWYRLVGAAKADQPPSSTSSSATRAREAVKTPKPRPVLSWEQWQVPSRTDIDSRLLVGAALFGVGWGLTGVCPGPALVGLANSLVSGIVSGDMDPLGRIALFTGCMVAGMGLGPR